MSSLVTDARSVVFGAPFELTVERVWDASLEAEVWSDVLFPTEDWSDYIEAAEDASTGRGTFLLRTIKTWGPAQ